MGETDSPHAPRWANYPTDVVQNWQFNSSPSIDPQMPQKRLLKRTRHVNIKFYKSYTDAVILPLT